MYLDSSREKNRLAALHSYHILDTDEESDYDELAQLASAICQMPIALITLIDEKRQWFKSHIGLSSRETPVEQSFCAHLVASSDDIMVVEDAHQDKRFKNNELVVGNPNIVFYAGVPLINEKGFALGSLCVIDNVKRQLTNQQKQALKIIAKQVMARMELIKKNEIVKKNDLQLHTLNEELNVINEELISVNQELNALVNQLAKEKKNTEKSELVLTLAMDAAELGTWYIDAKQGTFLPSERLKKLFGYSTEEEMSYDAAVNQIAESHRTLVQDAVNLSLTEARPYEIEYPIIRHNDKERRWVRAIGKLVEANEDEPEYFTGVLMDITTQVNNNQAIAESEKRFRNMAEGSGILIALGDETSNATYFSKAWVELLGRPMNDLLKFGWLDLVHPEDQKRYVNIYLDAFEDKVSFTGEFRILNNEGNYRWLLANGSPRFRSDDSFAGYISTCVDITDQLEVREQLKNSEERLQMLADNMSQLAWMADTDGYIFWYNQRWYEYTGCSFEESEGSGWRKVHHPDHVERVSNKYIDTISKGEIWEDTFPLLGVDGNFRWFLSRAVPLKSASGEIIRYFGTNTDITEHKEDEQRKNDFIAIVSHELKTPLTSIYGYLQVMQLLLKDSENERFKEIIGKSNAQVKKMNKLITGFLDVSRLDSGKIYLEYETFSLNNLIQDIIEDTNITHKSHEIILLANCNVNNVYADKDKIGQVIYNFLSNAIKYSPAGKKIFVDCKQTEELHIVSVRDEGMGIEERDCEKLFERFYRVENLASLTISGFGIGLYLCAEIIKRHNGKIWVDSKVGKGSTFNFGLPFSKESN